MINSAPKPSGYQGREMDNKARKEREEKQRQLVLAKRQLELKEADLRNWEAKQQAVFRELEEIQNTVQKSVTVTSDTVLNIKSFEQRDIKQIAENEKKIAELEQEEKKLKLEDESLKLDLENRKRDGEKAKKDSFGVKKEIDARNRLIQQKKQEKTKVDNDVKAIRQEIEMIKSRISALER